MGNEYKYLQYLLSLVHSVEIEFEFGEDFSIGFARYLYADEKHSFAALHAATFLFNSMTPEVTYQARPLQDGKHVLDIIIDVKGAGIKIKNTYTQYDHMKIAEDYQKGIIYDKFYLTFWYFKPNSREKEMTTLDKKMTGKNEGGIEAKLYSAHNGGFELLP